MCNYLLYVLSLAIVLSCQSGFTGSTCEFTSGRLSSEERGGVSAGAVFGAVIIVVIIVAVLFFAFK